MKPDIGQLFISFVRCTCSFLIFTSNKNMRTCIIQILSSYAWKVRILSVLGNLHTKFIYSLKPPLTFHLFWSTYCLILSKTWRFLSYNKQEMEINHMLKLKTYFKLDISITWCIRYLITVIFVSHITSENIREYERLIWILLRWNNDARLTE